MRRILATIGLVFAVGGAAALTPLLATLGAGATLTVVTLGLSIWRWFRRRNARAVMQPLPAPGVRSA